MIRIWRFIIFLTFLLPHAGCGASSPPITIRTEAEQKFLKICQEEYHLPIITKSLEHTLYIYLPVQENFFEYKANPTPQTPMNPKLKPNINFLAAEFSVGTFTIKYDISQQKFYPKDLGYTSSYSDSYQQKRNNMFAALYRTYADLEGNKAEKPPAFIIVVITDTTHGFESRETFAFNDYKYYMTQAIGQEEFHKRYLSELRGDTNAIGDMQGKHIAFKDMTWPEFLCRQIENRINFKYQRSDFPPSEDARKEIILQAASTLKAYSYKDFQSLILLDLTNGRQEPVSQQELMTYAQD